MINLMEHQKVGVKFLLENKRVILADEMGLGKTITSIVAIETAKAFPCVIIAPANVKSNWLKELRKVGVDMNNYSVHSYNRASEVYEQVYMRRLKVGSMIVDEAHFTNNRNSTRSSAVFDTIMLAKPKYVFFLTGTPIVNQPNEMFAMLVACGFINGTNTFIEAFNKYGLWDYNKVKKDEDMLRLKKDTESVILRREKSILGLPPTKIHPVFSIVDTTLYNKYLTMSEKVPKFHLVNRLKQLVGLLKVDATVALVEEVLKKSNKIIVFSYHREVQQRIADKLNCKLISSSLDHKGIARFKNSFYDVAVFSLRACSVGMNLQFADTIIFSELAWTPLELEQAESRIVRIGQQRPTNIYYVVAKETIDEHILTILERKDKYANLTVRDAKRMVVDMLMRGGK